LRPPRLKRRQADGYFSAGYTIIAVDYRLAPHAKLPQIAEAVEGRRAA